MINMDPIQDYSQMQDLSPYKVESRREVLALLKSIIKHQQLINMQGTADNAAVVTSMLEIDETEGTIIIDSAQDPEVNQALLDSDKLTFETALEQIRIIFFTEQLAVCEFEGRPAFQFDMPESVIRLQRREFYRMMTPSTIPVSCTVTSTDHPDGQPRAIKVPLQNVSGGGIALLDENGVLDGTIGRIYQNCKIDLPGGTLVIASLEIRNVIEFQHSNGKHFRRLGCLFIDIPHVMLAAIQRYISKLEREQNARSTGRI
jgi:c-di-GMP-binding flagellar brake protein YcgR